MKLIKVYSSISINEVNYIRSHLEACDIDAVVFDEATATIAPHYVFHQGGARVMVREEDVARASELIKDYENMKHEESCGDE